MKLIILNSCIKKVLDWWSPVGDTVVYSLSPQQPKEGAAGFQASTQPLFSQSSSPAKSPGGKEEEAVEEYEPIVDFKPIIDLPDLVEVKTGEEDETKVRISVCRGGEVSTKVRISVCM